MLLKLLASGIEGICDPMDPEQMAACHPLWDRAYRQGAPWRKVPESGPPRWFAGGETTRAAGDAVLVLCGPCTSTMDVAKWLCQSGAAGDGNTAVAAVSQRAGRGRKKSPWRSPPGNLYATWILPRMAEAAKGLFPMLIALAICRLLEGRGLSPRVKWPNDILLNGRKLAGILVEDTGGPVLAGIGINLSHAPGDGSLAMEGAIPATHLERWDESHDLLTLWEGLLAHCRPGLPKLLTAPGRREVVSQVEARLAWLGEAVMVRSPGGEYLHAGAVMGLEDDGALRVARGESMHRIDSSQSILPARR